MVDTWFDTIKEIIDGIVSFVKTFAAGMKEFIGGFGKEITGEPIEDKEPPQA